MSRSPRLMLLDTASLYFRAYYGVPDTLRAADGTPVNAVRGLLDMIARLVTDFNPSSLIACWDDDWRPQWRVDLIPTYKTHRLAAAVAIGPDVEVVPDSLTVQVPLILAALKALDIPVIGKAGYEADDIIGTLSTTASEPVDIITGDRDLFQLIDNGRRIRVIYTGRGMRNLEILTDAELVAKYGVTPQQYADFAAMRGDASDGLPGVPGVGEKTAVSLIAAFGDLDGIAAAAADQTSTMAPGLRTKILASAEYLRLAPTVVRVVRDLELPEVDATIRALPNRAQVDQLTAQWNLGGSAQRAVTALDYAAAVG